MFIEKYLKMKQKTEPIRVEIYEIYESKMNKDGTNR